MIRVVKSKKISRFGYSLPARVALTVFFVMLAVLILIPLYALLLGAFKGGAELFISGLNLNPTPDKLHLRAWRYLFTGIMSDGAYQPHDYFIWYGNSLLIVLVQGTLTLLVSSMVAYGFSKYRFRGKNFCFMCVLLVMMIPFEILMLPMYTQINAMGMRNSYAGVMLPFLANMSAIFFFRQFLEGVPYDLLDAGRVDGCTEYGIFFAGGHGRMEQPAVADACDFRHEEIHHPHRSEHPVVALWQQLRLDDHRFMLCHSAAFAFIPVRAEVYY